jgi:hypothetical protein
MSQDIYFLQVSGCDAEMMEKIVSTIGGEINTDESKIIAVPEKVEPLNRDEAMQYLEEVADALDATVE